MFMQLRPEPAATTSDAARIAIEFLEMARLIAKNLPKKPSGIPSPFDMAKMLARHNFEEARDFCQSVADAQPNRSHAKDQFSRSAHVYGCLASDSCDYSSLTNDELEESFDTLTPMLFETKNGSDKEEALAQKYLAVVKAIKPFDPYRLLLSTTFSLGQALMDKRATVYAVILDSIDMVMDKIIGGPNDPHMITQTYHLLSSTIIDSTARKTKARERLLDSVDAVLAHPLCRRDESTKYAFDELRTTLRNQGDVALAARCDKHCDLFKPASFSCCSSDCSR